VILVKAQGQFKLDKHRVVICGRYLSLTLHEGSHNWLHILPRGIVVLILRISSI
jgi:hypothetical protein